MDRRVSYELFQPGINTIEVLFIVLRVLLRIKIEFIVNVCRLLLISI